MCRMALAAIIRLAASPIPIGLTPGFLSKATRWQEARGQVLLYQQRLYKEALPGGQVNDRANWRMIGTIALKCMAN